MNRYAIVYAKFVDDKEIGTIMSGMFFGGIADSQEEADEIATKCVSETQGGIIIPKVLKMDTANILDAVRELEERFQKMAGQMYENEKTLGR